MKRFNFSLRKSKAVFRATLKSYRKKRKHLPPNEIEKLKSALNELQVHILQKNRKAASDSARGLEEISKYSLKKTPFEFFVGGIFMIGFALVVAVIVRSMWFEFFEIPTGSMRPTLKEKDRLAVSKTAFGINVPLTTSHFYFEPDLVQRGGIFVFTGRDMDIYDVNTMYFYLFPGKKIYVKRLMGKPGDTLYFYGGKIYGMDAEGNDITPKLEPEILSEIDHVPYIHLDGKVITPTTPTRGVFAPVTLYQMNVPVAQMSVGATGRIQSEMLYKNDAKKYYDLWGFKNYAMARLSTLSELKKDPLVHTEGLPDAPIYLELTHHPDIANARLGRDLYGRTRPMISVTKSAVPINEEHAKELFDQLYTARFHVTNGLATIYGGARKETTYALPLPGVPDGTYEFDKGKALKISWQGISTTLPKTHPIYQFSLPKLISLFNAGNEFDRRFLENLQIFGISPARFAYFRDGDLYVMGAKIYQKEDPTLSEFLEKEKMRPTGFIDYGAPLFPSGELDKEFIKAYGVTIPAKQYLALGDNYARSADSRDFGFVPEGNLRGAPELIFWPPGSRFGAPNQPPYPHLNLPRTIVWFLAFIVFILWYFHHKKYYKIPVDLSNE